MDALQVKKADLVTHDIGNMVGYALAAQFPQRITRWAVIDAPLPGIGNWDKILLSPMLWHFNFRGPDEERLVQGRERIYLDRFYNELSADPRSIDEATRDHYAVLYAKPHAMHDAFEQFGAFSQDAIDNKALLARGGKLSMPGPVDDSRIIVKRLAASKRLLVASNDHIKRYGRPSSLEELALHRGIIYGNRGAVDWRFRMNRKFAIVRPQVALRVNNGLLMRDAAVAGLGIALLPTFLLQIPLTKRTLKVLDVGAEAEGATIYIAYPEHLRSSAKTRGLTAWLQKSFGDPPHWDVNT
jgi:pimeloyl-ACP methyl ester carboxylesterase